MAHIKIAHNFVRLGSNGYPGRGFVCGLSECGRRLLQVYWITARSDENRDRMLVADGARVLVEPKDPNVRVKKPSLIFYNAMDRYNGVHVVTNGDHTDTIIQHLRENRAIGLSLQNRTYEEDEHATPRIAAIAWLEGKNLELRTLLLRKNRQTDECVRTLESSSNVQPGTGLCMTTYLDNGASPLPSFIGPAYWMPLAGSEEDLILGYWDILPLEHRVAIVLKSVSLETGAGYVLVKNKDGPFLVAENFAAV